MEADGFIYVREEAGLRSVISGFLCRSHMSLLIVQSYASFYMMCLPPGTPYAR